MKHLPGFCGLPNDPSHYDHASVVILPIPFDKTSTWIKGADRGPAALVEASQFLEFYDIETDSEVLKKGIYTAKPIRTSSSSVMIRKAERTVRQYLEDNKFVVVLGGEHSISIGVMKSYADYFKNLSILHLDAHADSRDSFEGSPYNHACVIARAREFTNNVISVGIRSMDVSERVGMNKKKVFFAHEIYDSDSWMTKVVRLLSDTVYITIDVDVFDPGIMPSTGTPEPGGLGWYQVMKLLRVVSKAKRVVGFDVVELCPSENKAPDFLAAKLVYTLLSYIFSNQRNNC